VEPGAKLLVGFTFATALVVGVVVSLATGSWWFLAVAIAIHAVGTFIVMRGVGKRLEQQEKPDPTTEARLEDQAQGRA
jgi:membrane protein implicated in regulation of membrane protease activity